MSSFDSARASFHTAVLRHYSDVGAGKKSVTYPKFEEILAPYSELATPPYYAFHTDLTPGRSGPRGFAAADGRVFLAIDGGSMSPFLQACHILDADRSVAAMGLAKRLAWVDPAKKLLVENPDTQKRGLSREQFALLTTPSVERTADGSARLQYWVVEGVANGGLKRFFRVTVTVTSDYSVTMALQPISKVGT